MTSLTAAAATFDDGLKRSHSHRGQRGNDSSRGGGDGWWEGVLPSGQLAERLRKAHRTSAAAASTSTAGVRTTSNTPSGSTHSTPGMTSSAFPSTRSEHSSPHISFPRAGGESGSGFADSSFRRRDWERVQKARERVQSLDSSRLALGPTAAHPAASTLSDEINAAARAGDGSRLAELKSRSRHQSMLATAPSGPSARSHLLRNDRLATDLLSPLARTPEMSSDEEQEEQEQEQEQGRAGSTSGRWAPPPSNPLSSTASHPWQRHQRIPRVVSSTVSANSTSMTEQDWADLINARQGGRSHWQEDRGGDETRSRRVSFDLTDQDARVHGGHHTFHTHGREYTYRPPPSGTSDEGRGHSQWFDTISASTHRRRTRMLRRETSSRSSFGTVPWSQTMSATSTSAPVSRRGSFSQVPSLHELHRERARAGGGGPTTSGSSATGVSSPDGIDLGPMSDLPVMRSIHAAQEQLTKTTSNALALSKSILTVPAPVLRPLFHFALIWCVSGATIMALVGCLFASYMLTAWDDFGETGREVRKQAGGWRPPAMTTPTLPHTMAMDAGRLVFDNLIVSPLTYAAKLPVAVAKSLAPSAVPTPAASRRASFSEGNLATDSNSSSTDGRSSDGEEAPLGEEQNTATPSSSARSTPHTSTTRNGSRKRKGRDTSRSRPSRPQNMPPRPPLTTLIPSMLFTVMLAIGAGLIGGWAKRRYSSGNGNTGNEGQATTPSHRHARSPAASSSEMSTPLTSPRIGSAEAAAAAAAAAAATATGGPASPYLWDASACENAGLGIAGHS